MLNKYLFKMLIIKLTSQKKRSKKLKKNIFKKKILNVQATFGNVPQRSQRSETFRKTKF